MPEIRTIMIQLGVVGVEEIVNDDARVAKVFRSHLSSVPGFLGDTPSVNSREEAGFILGLAIKDLLSTRELVIDGFTDCYIEINVGGERPFVVAVPPSLDG